MSLGRGIPWELVRRVLRPKAEPAGLRVLDYWRVADGDKAAAAAITAHYRDGGTAPTEIAMAAQLAARYGAQIAVSKLEVVLFIPEGIPDMPSRVALTVGYAEVPADGYQVFRWSAA